VPRTCQVSPRFDALVAAQDYVVTRQQAYAHGLTRSAIANRRRYDGWQELVTGVFLCHGGDPARRQLLVAAQLFAGADSAIDDVDACRYYGIMSAQPDDHVVHVVVPARSPVRSRGFVVVRRSAAPFGVMRTQLLRYVDPADAVIAAARRRTNERAVVALVSDAVQRKITTRADLTRAHVQGPPRNARLTDDALAHIAAGIRSAPEADFRKLAEASVVLPPLLYNRKLRLPTGRVVRPDALALDAGLIHETNGKLAHRRDDLFDDMQERHDAMTETGLILLHNTPRRIWLRPREVIVQFERVYLAQAGRGLPPGVVLLPDDE
jgi:hypothetical protein